MGVERLLRCSVLRETPMASAIHFKKLNCYKNETAYKLSMTTAKPIPPPAHREAIPRLRPLAIMS